jgi:hypothetical protein
VMSLSKRGLEPEVGSGGKVVLPWRKLFKTVGFESVANIVSEQFDSSPRHTLYFFFSKSQKSEISLALRKPMDTV